MAGFLSIVMSPNASCAGIPVLPGELPCSQDRESSNNEQTEECGNTPRKVHGLQESGRSPFVMGEAIPSFLGFINSTLHVSGFLKIGLN